MMNEVLTFLSVFGKWQFGYGSYCLLQVIDIFPEFKDTNFL
jgi:hypothetical protein